MTTLRRVTGRHGLPLTAGWGLRLATLAAIISGVSVWLNGFAVTQVPDPAVYTTLKNLVAGVLLLGGALAMGGARQARGLARRDWLTLGMVGLIGGSVPFLLFFTGLSQVSAPGAAFIHKTLFVWVALLAVPFLGERLGGLQAGALGVLVVGQVLLLPPRLDGVGWGMGETLIAAATALWAVEVIVVKRLLVEVPPAVVGAARLGFGVAFLIGFLALTGGLAGIASVSVGGWAWVMVTGVILAAYVGTWLAALRRAPASAVAAMLVVGAVITAGLQALSNGVVPSATAMAGALALLAAAAIVASGPVRAARRMAVDAARA